MDLDRRAFMQTAMSAAVLAKAAGAQSAGQATVSATEREVRAEGKSYAWRWSPNDDHWSLLDKRGRLITSGSLQPVVVLQSTDKEKRHCLAAKMARRQVDSGRLTVVYETPDGSASLTLTLLFEDTAFWMKPVVFQTRNSEDVVSLHYFAVADGESATPRLYTDFLILPGVSESSALSPVIPAKMGLRLTSWLGHGGPPGPGVEQQWGLPTHFFAGLSRDGGLNQKGTMRDRLSDAFCCGLADLPAGDLFFETRAGMHSPIVEVRSDLWGHARGPGRIELGATLCWTTGGAYREAIRNYYLALMNAGIVRKKRNSAAKNAVVTASAFDTWGAQLASTKGYAAFDESTLNDIYQGVKESGMTPKTVVLDDKWEGEYGLLEHSPERFPAFEKTLARFRADGRRVGLWAAFLRCQNPARLGLTTEHVLRKPGGAPVYVGEAPAGYYLLDLSQAKVQAVITAKAKAFVRRYQPDLVKFDFGYEIPAISAAAPKDLRWAGERLLQKSVEVVVNAMREERPDLVVMYYCLSPLFTEYFDLHSVDDLYLCGGDYDLEARRRFYFSSLLGELGIPTYGSGGYDWGTMRQIWFDSAPIGSVGSLNTFLGDETDARPTPEIISKYNGLTHLVRRSNVFSIEPIDEVPLGSLRGAQVSSCARIENGEPVLVALREWSADGQKGKGRYREDVRASTSVIVASKVNAGIAKANRLAVVPYGDGELLLRRAEAKWRSATVTEHLFQAAPRTTRVPIVGGTLKVALRERLPDGPIVEWMEVTCE